MEPYSHDNKYDIYTYSWVDLGASVGASHCPLDSIVGSTPIVSAIHRNVAYAPSVLAESCSINMSEMCLLAGLTGLGLGKKSAYLAYLTQIHVSAKTAFRFVLSVQFYVGCNGHQGTIGKSYIYIGSGGNISPRRVLRFSRDLLSQF